jgi:hypothetical protein
MRRHAQTFRPRTCPRKAVSKIAVELQPRPFPTLAKLRQAAGPTSLSTSARSAGTAWRLPEVAQPDVAVAALEQPSAPPAAVVQPSAAEVEAEQPSAAEVAAERSPAAVAEEVATGRPSSAQAVVVRTRAAVAAVAAHSRVVVAAVTASQSEARR